MESRILFRFAQDFLSLRAVSSRLTHTRNRLGVELSGWSRDWTGVKVLGVCDSHFGKHSRNVDGESRLPITPDRMTMPIVPHPKFESDQIEK